MDMDRILKEMIDELYPYAQKYLKFDKPAKVEFIHDDEENAKNVYGKTAYYDPDSFTVVLYTHGRHPKDIIRSYCHEITHHLQNCRGDLKNKPTNEDYAQNDVHLRKMEAEAYETGNLLLRDFESLKRKQKEGYMLNESTDNRDGERYKQKKEVEKEIQEKILNKRHEELNKKLIEKFIKKTPVKKETDND